MDELVTHLKTSGFIFPGSDIYGGMANTWDYGPLGSLLKNNLKQAWREAFIQNIKQSYEVDAAILMHPKVWEASGHVSSFSDPLMDCKDCKSRFRADHLIESFASDENPDAMTSLEMEKYIIEHKIKCPKCGQVNFTPLRDFNLMFKTERGVTDKNKNIIYLRPENAQGEYVNYLNVMRSMRAKIPFSIGQIGKAFRNEITPGNFTFRTIEFEQMEHQTFCKPGDDEALYEHFKNYAFNFIVGLGIDPRHLRFKDHAKLAHYAKAASDIEYLFPFGWGELNGTHNRKDFDLSNHQQYSGETMTYNDLLTNEKYIPYVVESTIGVDRLALTVLSEAYNVEKVNGEDRIVMKFKSSLAPYKACIMPLNKKLHQSKAEEVYNLLKTDFMVLYDETASIGKRYRRQDMIGTPYSITIDDETYANDTVTVRDRDSMEQVFIKISELNKYIYDKINM